MEQRPIYGGRVFMDAELVTAPSGTVPWTWRYESNNLPPHFYRFWTALLLIEVPLP